MKKAITILGILSFGLVYSQSTDGKVGINTETPEATLQVKSLQSAKKNLELENSVGKKLVTVTTNGAVGINQSSPTQPLSIVSETINNVTNNDISLTDFMGDNPTSETLVNTPTLGIRRYRGTRTSPSMLKEGDYVGHVSFGIGDDPSSKEKMRTSLVAKYINGDLAFQVEDIIGDVSLNIQNKKVAIGGGEPKERFHVQGGKVRIDNLSGAGDRPVFADKDGVLKIGTATVSDLKATSTDAVCDASKVGGIFYKEINGNGVFGFCTKRGNDYVWGYMVGGSNMYGTSASGAKFGDGL